MCDELHLYPKGLLGVTHRVFLFPILILVIFKIRVPKLPICMEFYKYRNLPVKPEWI